MSITAPPEQRPATAPQPASPNPKRKQGRRVSPRQALLVASLKMFYRNKHSIFWTLLLPVIILGVFALLNLGGGVTAQLGIIDDAHTAGAQKLVAQLGRSSLVSLHTGASLSDEQSALGSGDRDALLVIDAKGLHLTLNSARSHEADAARLVIDAAAAPPDS